MPPITIWFLVGYTIFLPVVLFFIAISEPPYGKFGHTQPWFLLILVGGIIFVAYKIAGSLIFSREAVNLTLSNLYFFSWTNICLIHFLVFKVRSTISVNGIKAFDYLYFFLVFWTFVRLLPQTDQSINFNILSSFIASLAIAVRITRTTAEIRGWHK